MVSIKKSFANCLECPLLKCPSCILETNCEDDLSKVEVVYIAENPGKEEVKGTKKMMPRPLVGPAGQMFRKYFKRYGLDKRPYLLTNTVLCQTLNPDGTTGNPTDDVINECKINAMQIVRTCKPKVVVLMGASPTKAFGIAKAGITDLHGKFVEWEGFNVYLMVHPSFVNRQQKVWEPKFEEGLAKLEATLSGKEIDIHAQSEVKISGKGIHRYKLPDKFYTDKYRLIDIQFLSKKRQVLYIFRDQENNKVYHTMNDDYYCYQVPDGIEPRKLIPYDQLNQVVVPYLERTTLDPSITYEGDIKISSKHATDYYFFNQSEAAKVSSNVMFFDIEVDTGDKRVFPNQKDAAFPINMISTIYNGKCTCFVVDNKTEPITDKGRFELKIFNNEKALVRSFIKYIKDEDPDFMAGWNAINFDMWYIFNRMPKIGISHSSFNQFGEFYVDGAKYVSYTPGMNVMDQEFLYRTFTFTKMENYKLAFISNHELGVSKIQMPLPFNEMYWKMLNKTIEYNIRDTELLEKLENKLKHINLMNELRIVCSTSFEGTTSSGQIDGLVTAYLKNEKKLASKNADPHITKEDYPGAYVYEPIAGIYNHVTDFDFASLYPSIIITYNIGPNNFVMKFKDNKLGYDLAYQPEKLPEKFTMVIDPTLKKQEIECTPEQLFNKMKEHNWIHTINGCFFKQHNDEMSIFSEVLDMLLGSRKQYKGKMFEAIQAKDAEQEEYYYTRQLVYKVLANTLYGVVANVGYRFFDTSLAAAVTLGGQEALKTSIIEGDAFMRHLDTGKEYKRPKTLTKQEMFAEPSTPSYYLPDRSHDYIITGDTDSIFCCFERFKQEKTVDNLREWCNQIQNFLNDERMVEVVKRHNVDNKFNRLSLKNELVISRGLFLAKKRYAIRVVNNEGKDVDKINYMGVEIKRSDYPSKSKEFLTELSELILKSDVVSLSNLLQFVNQKEKEFIKLIKEGDKSIARPVSFGKPLDKYKTVPQGVRAMLAWNNIMYEIHHPGAKAYMYRVKGIDPMKAPKDVLERYEKFVSEGNKLEVVAIPDEEEKLPNYFIPDIAGNLTFVFKDRYELMLAPLIKAKKQMEVLTF